MTTSTLTTEERAFANEHADLVERFLAHRRLDARDYYDIVATGYIKGVRDYLRKPELQQYKLYTIVTKRMSDALNAHWKSMHRPCREGIVLSLDDSRSLGEAISAPDTLMHDFEMKMLLQSLASEVTPEQMAVITLKVEGYGLRDIARMQRVTPACITRLLEGAREAIVRICIG